MHIIEVTLHGYKRFKLLNVKTVKYTPSRRNLILGTNGSGKSSLMSRLTPIPPDRKSFIKGGFQHTIISHKNKVYELHSEDGKHSFIVDNKNLNDGGTLKVQLALIKSHLGVTPFIMSVLQGDIKFHEMSTQERKDWFSDISSVSYDFAFNIFNKSKSRLRDLTGSLKIANSKLASMTTNTMDKNSYTIAVSNRDALNSVQQAIRVSMPLIEDKVCPKANIKNILKKLEKVKSISTTPINLDDIKHRIKSIQLEIENETSIISKLESEIKVDTDTISKSIDILRNKKEVLEKKLSHITGDKKAIYESFIKNRDKLKILISNMETNYVDIDQSKLNSMISTRDLLISKVSRLRESLSSITSKLSVLTENKKKEEVECPKCSTKFRHGYDESEFISTSTILNSTKKTLTQKEQMLETLDKQIKDIEAYINARMEFQIAISPEKELYSYLTELSPMVQFNSLVSSLDDLYQYTKCVEDLDKLIIQYNSIESSDAIRNAGLKANINSKTELVHKLVEKLSILRTELTTAKRNNELIDNKIKLQSALEDALRDVNPYIKNEINKMKIKSYNEILKVIDEDIAKLDESIRLYERTELVITNLRADIENTKKDIRVVKIIVDSLSPTDGLIGESLSGFISVFLNRVNAIIADVWGYDMEIIYDIGDSLTYSFPIRVNGEKINNDLSESSSGMKEVISLAFVLASISVANLNVPIYLDEFAKALDQTHRRAAVDMIKKIDEQVFIISHYNDLIHPFITNDSLATVSVLDANNVETGNLNKYNENIILS